MSGAAVPESLLPLWGWHLTLRENRRSIRARGLEPRIPRIPGSGGLGAGPYGVYFTLSPVPAYRETAMRAGAWLQVDVWRADLRGLPVFVDERGDRELARVGASPCCAYTPGPIEPERLVLDWCSVTCRR